MPTSTRYSALLVQTSHGARRRERQTHNSGTGQKQLRIPIVIETHHSAAATERRRYIQTPLRVERQPLRTAQAAIVGLHFTGGRNTIHRIEAGCGGPATYR